ncbi:alpha/beta fold hydrolase [Kordiimonas lacus]|uniref:Pimeloyl-ACP methyl ester carboxylesterase n=1 Tax=Kordiimonas lacus TaxID=637679 RepID=A0A1G6XKW3_9PROT|nr:alpha/beta hydrolase [Kordiimonas lacus]SDD78884.1 Pimeloyl-ACP methyl ester carboxylesterase [Kordiimonas lacus]
MKSVVVRNSVTLEYEMFGQSGNNGTVLLVSGAGAPATFWPLPFCKRLADAGLRVIRYNHRDTGGSTHFDQPYSLEELVQDMMALLDALSVAEVHLIGHSMGGYMAQLAMVLYPEKIRSIVSMSAGSVIDEDMKLALGLSSPNTETWAQLMKNVPVGDLDQDLPGWLESMCFLNGGLAFDRLMARDYVANLYSGDPRNAMVADNHIHAMTTVPSTLAKGVGEASQPMLVLHGQQDLLVPIDNGKHTCDLAGRARGNFIKLEEAGHMFFNQEIWQEIGDSIVDFITGQE